ncbi:Uncharacterised protein [Mycoplasmopsis arginini]|nr:Uncharacterised protein [Chlamydia trachomatis]SGA03318.1 Uncharacterised protein [Chlamydia abortus]SGA24119.1 Uncharacterised protein [Mycoplasmopsis arginini]CRH46923.1 Uncharacterised protein [Chlamydia trachomatis]CRH54969.1 Uncharacterised protein [Chlamydia trachomatis]
MLSVVLPEKTNKILGFIKQYKNHHSLINKFDKFDNLSPQADEILFSRIIKK